jgi:signal transduction histidine kinase
MMSRLRRLGLQKRIMLYVTVGLAVMFGMVAVLGLSAIDEATQLVYRERLTTAHITAGIFERDFARVAAEVDKARSELFPGSGSRPPAGAATRLLARFELDPEPYPFFRVGGVWLLDSAGGLLDQAGEPHVPAGSTPRVGTELAAALRGHFEVFTAAGTVKGALSFAAVAVRIERSSDSPAPVAVIHTVSVNRIQPYVPADHGQPGGAALVEPAPAGAAQVYHLEVVGPDGVALLGIGPDERPGEPSPHYPVIQRLVATRAAATVLHEPLRGEEGEPHVMAAVPLGSSPFYVVLEQPVDVALALPNQLRDGLFLSIGIGFLLTLLVAWVTTRHVVTPTEQLTRAAERMAGGDLASPIKVTAQDEVGQLADSLEAMRRRLQAALASVEQTNRELETRVADRTARLGRVLRTTISAQEEERHRLARELHDETAQTLAALAIVLDRARDAFADDLAPPEANAHILEARAIAARLLEETRRLILGLRPSILDDLGLVPAIRWLCETSLGDKGIDVSIEVDRSGVRLPGHVEVSLFRIVQEAISNVARHADASHVRIALEVTDGIARVTIADDGRGFDPAQAMGPAGSAQSVGLVGMQERVGLIDGRMEVHSWLGAGTEIVVEVPVVPEAA